MPDTLREDTEEAVFVRPWPWANYGTKQRIVAESRSRTATLCLMRTRPQPAAISLSASPCELWVRRPERLGYKPG